MSGKLLSRINSCNSLKLTQEKWRSISGGGGKQGKDRQFYKYDLSGDPEIRESLGRLHIYVMLIPFVVIEGGGVLKMLFHLIV